MTLSKKSVEQLKTRHIALGYVLQVHNQSDMLDLPDLVSEVYDILKTEFSNELAS